MEQRTEYISLKPFHTAELRGGTDFNGLIGVFIISFNITIKKSLEKQANCTSKVVAVPTGWIAQLIRVPTCFPSIYLKLPVKYRLPKIIEVEFILLQ